MNLTVKSGKLSAITADVLVLRVGEKGVFSQSLKEIDTLTKGYFRAQKRNRNLPQKSGETVIFYDVAGLKAKRVMVVCTDLSTKSLQRAIKRVTQAVKKHGWSSAVLALVDNDEAGIDLESAYQMAFQQIYDDSYVFADFKTKASEGGSLEDVSWVMFAENKSLDFGKNALKRAQAWAKGTYLTRRLGDLPPNVCQPAYLGKTAKSLAKQYPELIINVLKRKDIKALGMGALLGVAQGSAQHPRFITMEYKPANARNKKPVVLVGKGVTFDSGGISIKPGAAMDEMKFDMCGAATVFGVINAICYEKLDVYVVGIVAAVENMPGGNATRPGDILTSMSGKTIEVLNTDAEGRLILCDALTYAERYEPQAVIDMATLTGACVVALGSHRAGLLGNDKRLIDALFVAGEAANDPVWPLPLDQEYKDLLKSPFADLPNISSKREAGTIVAAAFLAEFAEKYSWAHLDIAGVAWRNGQDKGGSGRPVGLLLTYLRHLANA